MLKRSILLPLLVFWLSSTFGQSKKQEWENRVVQNKMDIHGWVIDKDNGVPLQGATVYFPELKKGAVTDSDGSFRISNIPATNLLFEISYQGYRTVSEVIKAHGSTNDTFYLSTQIVEQPEVTVTGVSIATRLRQNPQAISTVNKNDLFRTSATNLMDALASKVPGFSVLTTGPAIAKPFIRGLGYSRVVTIHDGIKQEGQQWGDEHGMEIDDNSVQKIEVVKGPASLIYGSDAIAGVINIQSQMPVPEGTVKGNIVGEYQTNQQLAGTFAQMGGTRNGISWNIYGNHKAAKDYSNNYDGKVYNSRFINTDFGGMAGYAGNWGYTRLLITNYDLVAGIVEGLRDSATGAFVREYPDDQVGIVLPADFKKLQPEIPYQRINHFKTTIENGFNFGAHWLDLVAAFQNNTRMEFGSADEPNQPQTEMDLKTVNYSLKWRFPSYKKWKTSAGISGMFQNNTNLGDEKIIPDYHLFDAGIYFYGQYIQNAAALSGGIRFDTRHLSATAMENDILKLPSFERQFANVSGSLGLTYTLSRRTYLKVNIARGFRSPNLAELASNGEHEGTGRYEIGDKELKNEVSLQTDIGIEIHTDHLAFTASLFYNSIDNFIFSSKINNAAGQDSVIVDEVSGKSSVVYRYGSRNAFLYGGELYLDLHPHPLDWLHFENTFSYTVGKFKTAVDGSDNLPLIPSARLSSELKAKFFAKGNRVRNLFFSLSSNTNFNQNRPFTGYGTETATTGYMLLNAAMGAEYMRRDKNLFSIIFSVNNLTDKSYQNHLSRLKYTDFNYATGRRGVFEPGRNFSVKLNIPLSFSL